MYKKLTIILLALCMSGCASTGNIMQQSKADFKQGNYQRSFTRIIPLAEQGNADAQYAVGYMYYYGKGTEKDLDKAQDWIRRAAAQGQPQAIKARALLNNTQKKDNSLIQYPESLDVIQ